jgi:hypothetical protein
LARFSKIGLQAINPRKAAKISVTDAVIAISALGDISQRRSSQTLRATIPVVAGFIRHEHQKGCNPDHKGATMYKKAKRTEKTKFTNVNARAITRIGANACWKPPTR